MERELKLSVPDTGTLDAIWKDLFLSALSRGSEGETVRMRAVYYDTPDGLLKRNHTALRIRAENDAFVITAKWGGGTENGFHRKEEVNAEIDRERAAEAAGDPLPAEFFISALSSCPGAAKQLSVSAGTVLFPMLSTDITRRRKIVYYGGSKAELAVDSGRVLAGGLEDPICEIELELFAGDPDGLLALGRMLSEKYKLVPEDRTKYSRGMALLKKSGSRE